MPIMNVPTAENLAIWNGLVYHTRDQTTKKSEIPPHQTQAAARKPEGEEL
jgi:hypothetical protein